MIWLTWRQCRTQFIAVFGLVAAACVWLAITGPSLARLAHRNEDVYDVLTSNDRLLFNGGIAVLAVAPAVIGIFWGAPLVARELETGTYRLAWNQSVTRSRWLAVKLGFSVLATAVAVGILTTAITWWAHPIDGARGSQHGSLASRLTPISFAMRGIVPVGYAVFALLLGTLIGLILRRSVPAMALTLAIYVIVQIAVPLWVRPHLVPPTTTLMVISPATLDGISTDGSGTNTHHHPREPGRLDPDRPDSRRSGPCRSPPVLVQRLPAPPPSAGQSSRHGEGGLEPPEPGCLLGTPHRRGLSAAPRVPAAQPLLAPAVGRDRRLPHRLSPACRALGLVDAPPAVLTATDLLSWLSRGRGRRPGAAVMTGDNVGMVQGSEDTVAFRLWPPVAIGGPLVAGWLATLLWGDPVDLGGWRVLLGWALVVLFVGWNGWSLWLFQRHETGLLPGQATHAMIEEGPYRLSRNPLYVGLLALYVAAALLAPTIWGLVLFPAAVLLVRWGAIRPEERFLHERFGAQYDDYTRRVRRWL